MEQPTTIAGADKVEKWRYEQLLRMWPDMPLDHAAGLAMNQDAKLLEKASALRAGDCTSELAYEILL